MIYQHTPRLATEEPVFSARSGAVHLFQRGDKEKSMKTKQPPFLRDMGKPVDPDTFVYMMQVFQSGAQMTIPVENPSARPAIVDDDGTAYALTDTPMNRGMGAVMKELSETGEGPAQAYLVRIMHMGEIFRDHGRFGRFMKSEGDDFHSVSAALLRAAATAKFTARTDKMGFDLDDVLAKANAFAEQGQRE